MSSRSKNVDLGFHDLTEKAFDDSAVLWYRTIMRIMDTTGIDDPAGRGTWHVRAEGLTGWRCMSSRRQ